MLDANQIAHVSYVENGEPRIIPTLYMRRGDYVYLHGNRQAAFLRHLAAGGLAAISVMCADGIVVARSGFHCSMNYRSVVIFGEGEAVPAEEHEEILDAFVDALIPGHAAAVRPAYQAGAGCDKRRTGTDQRRLHQDPQRSGNRCGRVTWTRMSGPA